MKKYILAGAVISALALAPALTLAVSTSGIWSVDEIVASSTAAADLAGSTTFQVIIGMVVTALKWIIPLSVFLGIYFYFKHKAKI